MYSYVDFSAGLTPFGAIFLAAIFVAWWWARRNAAAVGVHGSHVDLIVPITIIGGVAGGTVLAAFMPMDHMVAGEAMNHGIRIRLFGILGAGAIFVFVYSRMTKLSFRRLLDIFALPTIAGLMIHRIGCHVAGCCWGDIVSHAHTTQFAAQVQTTKFLEGIVTGVQYPPGSLPYAQHLALGLIGSDAAASLPVYPVQLYEAGVLLLMLLAFRALAWRRLPKGSLAVMVVCAYALQRFFMEYLRADGHLVLGNLTVTQLQCIVLMSSVLLLPRLRKPVVS